MKSLMKIFLKQIGLFSIVKDQLNKRYLREENKKRIINYKSEFDQFAKLSKNTKVRFSLNWDKRMPCLEDKTATTPFDRHYIYHPAWAARILHRTQAVEHIDISSILHFSTIVSAFIPVKFYDYRPAQMNLSGLSSDTADLTALPFESNSIQSISCMHTIEHIGLGRYSDPLDYDGDLKAIKELRRVVAPGGNLLFVVPIGKAIILFNGHRIYSYQQIIECFPEFQLMDFSLIPDDSKNGGLINNASREIADEQNYGCGCFWFKKNSLDK